MKKVILLFAVLVIFKNSSNAQFHLQYSDTTVNPGSNITLAVLNESKASALLVDDQFSGKIDIGFSFEYFGTSYSKCVLSGNNFLSFDTTLANTTCGFVYSQTLTSGQLNHAILFPVQDLNSSMAGHTSYKTVGIAPNRKFIVSICKTPLYGCNSIIVTDQLVLNESNNTIEMYITSKPNASSCTMAPDQGTAIQGLKNNSTQVYVPGRDVPMTQWSATNDAKLFTPSGISNYTITTPVFQSWHMIDSINLNHIKWYDENNTYLGEGLTQTVTPGINTHYYTARYSGVIDCDTNAYSYVDTVHITLNDTTTTPPTGINGASEINKSVFVYPNPASENITVEFKSNIKIENFILFNAMGESFPLHYNMINGNRYSIGLKNLSSGLYYLEISTDKGIIRRKVEIIKL